MLKLVLGYFSRTFLFRFQNIAVVPPVENSNFFFLEPVRENVALLADRVYFQYFQRGVWILFWCFSRSIIFWHFQLKKFGIFEKKIL